MANLFDNLKNKYLELLKPAQQTLGNVGNQIANTVASVPYAIKNYQQSFVQKHGIPMDFNKQAKQEDATVKSIESKPKWQQPLAEQMAFGGNPQVSGGSAEMHPLINDITPIPPTSPYLESVKQKVLANPNLRPVAKEYLSKIPIVYTDLPKGSLGQARQKYIAISNKMANSGANLPEKYRQDYLTYQAQKLEKVIQHELLHKTPRLVRTDLFNPKNQPIINQYVERWGKDYMNNPGALVEEMFAEQDIPPAYYWHIFKNLNPKATKQNFVDYLKSWFVNKISNNVPMPQNNGIQGTVVPMSGGDRVQN